MKMINAISHKLLNCCSLKYLIVIAIIACSCATIKNPDGGPKDEIAPKPISIAPAPNTINFIGNGFTIVFDEFIKLVDPKKNVLISPPLKSAPEFKIKGKVLYVNWKDTLRENTTYNFYFANAIVDFNEGNDTSFSYVFSTGDQLDSLQIYTTVIDAYSLKPMEDTWIFAYTDDNFNPSQEAPDFISKTDKKGIATLSNLPNKPLNLIALKDRNFNLKYDHLVDEIAFLEESVKVGGDLVVLKTSMPLDTMLTLESTVYVHPGTLRLVFNQEADPQEVFINDALNSRQSPNDTLIYYCPGSLEKGKYALLLNLNNQTDTVSYYVAKSIDSSFIKPVLMNQGSLRSNKVIEIDFLRPIESFDPNLISVQVDSVEQAFKPTIADDKPNILRLDSKWLAGKSYQIRLQMGAIQGAHLTISDSMLYRAQIREADYFAQLTLNVEQESGHCALLKNNRVIMEFKADGQQTIQNLLPGKYTLSLFIDSNGDGEWTPGDFLEGRRPEAVYYYPEIIELRSGWAEELKWLIPTE